MRASTGFPAQGTRSVLGNAVWNPGANYNWRIRSASCTKGSTIGYDGAEHRRIARSKRACVGNEFNISVWLSRELGPTPTTELFFSPKRANSAWTILTASNGIAGFSADTFAINLFATNGTAGFANALGGGTFSIAQSGNDLNLIFSTPAVPEPGTWTAAALLLGAAGYVRWRKRNSDSA